jgi:hypothetical protein
LLRYSECTICVMSASFIRKSCIAGNVASWRDCQFILLTYNA